MKDTRLKTVDGDPINPDMGEGRYQDTLRRFRQRIADGLELDAEDSDTTGDKYTSCEWGLCSSLTREAYPDVNDHVFPKRLAEQLKRYPRDALFSPRDPPEGATCPLDRGLQKPDELNPGHQGCFYRCRVFSPERKAKQPTREETLKRYDDLLADREAKHGKKITADDNESHWKPRGP